ncbi:hypothetical protein I4U23_024171 [Adineta vaga]|nr:hypothetical protein I4U23_024171 [Adineta vaga]
MPAFDPHLTRYQTNDVLIQNLTASIDVHQSLIAVANNYKQQVENNSDLLCIRRDSEKKRETPEERLTRLSTIHEHLTKQRSDYLKRIQYTLPQPPEIYLRIILGSELPASILDKSEQWKYKESYEQFKLHVILILMIISLLMSTIIPINRALDALFHFLLVWYYCALTICESFLMNYKYPFGGFQSWMLRGLSFLFIGYPFELYNAYVLFKISMDPKIEPNPD